MCIRDSLAVPDHSWRPRSWQPPAAIPNNTGSFWHFLAVSDNFQQLLGYRQLLEASSGSWELSAATNAMFEHLAPPTLSVADFSPSFSKVFRSFGRQRRTKISKMIVRVAAIDSGKKSSKSERSSRFFGHLKFSAARFNT